MELFLWIVATIASLVILAKSSGYFVLFSEKIGLALGISSYIIGATIVALGTSMPELITSIIGQGEISTFAIDNVIGSNIANSALVIGIAAIVAKKLQIKNNVIDVDIPFLLVASGLFLLFIIDGIVTFREAITLFIMFGIYVAYTLSKEGRAEVQEIIKTEMVKKPPLKAVFFLGLVVSAGALYLGGKFTVTSILKVSELLNIQSSIMTMIIVALGTSLPEVFVSVGAALKGKAGLAVGNAFGSNIFNIALVTGIPALYTDVKLSPEAASIGIPFFIVATLVVLFTTTDDKVSRWEGWGLLLIYFAFVGKLTGII